MDRLKLYVEKEQDILVAILASRYDNRKIAYYFKRRMHEMIDCGVRNMIVEASKIDCIDATGFGILIGGHRRLKALNGDLIVACSSSRIRRIFDITGMDKFFNMCETIDEAVGKINAPETETA